MYLLCVDDDADFLDLTVTYLERKLPSATIHATTRIDEAHEVLETEPITCIVSDHDMPERTGLEFLREIRADRPDLPFILFTGKGSEEIASEAISAGVTDYLQKRGSEQYDRLAARIRHAVSEYRTERELEERVKELTAIQRTSDCLADESAPRADRLQEVVDYLPGSLRYPEHAVARLTVGDETFESAAYERPVHRLTAHEDTIDGGRLGLMIGYGTEPPNEHDDDPFLPEERELLGTVLQLVAGYLDRQHVLGDLREADRRLRLILENTTAAMYLKDADGTYVFVNEEYRRLFDLRDEEVVGSTDADVHPASLAEEVRENDRRVLETGEPIKVEERITVDGTERTYLSVKVPVRGPDGEVDGVFGVSTDITERKHRETQLEELNRAIPDLLSADSHREIAELGVRAARDILGLRANAIHLYEDGEGLVPVAKTELVSELVGDLPTFTGGDGIAWRVFREGTATAIDEVTDDPDVHDPDTPIRSELYLPLGEYGILVAGSPDAAAFDQQDVTAGELLATHIAASLDQLTQKRRLRERETELERKNERLDQFSSMVSHDLRNPISVAIGRLELYRETGDESNLDAVETALDRTRELVTDLTALARTGTTRDEHERVSASDLAREAWNAIDTRDASLSVEAFSISAHRSQLRALLENLFRNAVGHGGPEVTVRVGPMDAGFYVEDTGSGIPAEHREDVFEHGYSTGYGGSGIGLTIVGRIADAHGWTVELAESDEGGARFEFRGIDSAE